MEILVVHGWVNRIRAKAAAIYFVNHRTTIERIIFSGGRTAGKMNPSEAENMKTIFLEQLQKLIGNEYDERSLDVLIQLEENSYDTESNAKGIQEISGVERSTPLMLLSSLSHLPRIRSIYQRIGFQNVSTISAEWIIWQTGKIRYQEYIARYLNSIPVLRASRNEKILRIATRYKLGRMLIHFITKNRIKK